MNAKTPTILCLLLVAFTTCAAQDEETANHLFVTKKGRPVYFSIFGQMGIPVKDFKNYSKVQGGAGLDVGLGFLENKRSLSAGAGFFVLTTGMKKDTYNGAEIKTSSGLALIGPLLRWAPMVPWRVIPFVSASGGLGISSTNTTSEIVDKATFAEQFFGMQADDIVTTTYHKQSAGASIGYSLSAGILIKPAFILSFSYFGIDKVKYVNINDVAVENGEVVYKVSQIPVQVFNITLGFSNWAHH